MSTSVRVAPRAVPVSSLAILSFSFLALLGPGRAQTGLHIGPDEKPQTQPAPMPPGPMPPVPQPHQRPIIIHPHLRTAPRIRLVSDRIKSVVTDGVADTTTEQVLRNDGDMDGEATFMFPLPPDAVADRFTMTMDGKEVAAEVMAADKARAIYEEIVARRRDPGLLEYVGCGLLRARLFPIPPRGETRVTLRYRCVLRDSSGVYEFTYPLRAAGANQMEPESVAVDVEIRSSKGVRNVWTPLPGAEIKPMGDQTTRVTFESRGRMPEHDLRVWFGLTDAEFGVNLLANRRPGSDGFFLMMVSPRRDAAAEKAFPKCVTFVLDTSGSMAGKKMEQARGALKFFLEQLKPGDAFNVIPFSTEARPLFGAPVEASRPNLDKAIADVATLEARGGTNIGEALDKAIGAGDSGGRVRFVVFITDGLPTVGTTDVDAILASARKRNTTSDRVFVFGVGHDVNTRLLDTLAEESRAARDYVREDESIEVKVSSLVTKLTSPAMTDVDLSCEGITGYDVFPRRTPDLFRGDRLLVFGRYKGEGTQKIKLRGRIGGEQREFVYDATFPLKTDANDFIPSLWAQRKVAFLLDEIRLKGMTAELRDEVTRLGREYSIVTPYTSQLILEDGQRVASARGVTFDYGVWEGRERDSAERLRLFGEMRRAGLEAPRAQPTTPGAGGGWVDKASEERAAFAKVPADGRAAVEHSLKLKELKDGGRQEEQNDRFGSTQSRRVKDKAFFLLDGVWVDAAFDAAAKARVKKVKAFSPEYFELLRSHPELGAYLAIGERVAVVLGELVIETEP